MNLITLAPSRQRPSPPPPKDSRLPRVLLLHMGQVQNTDLSDYLQGRELAVSSHALDGSAEGNWPLADDHDVTILIARLPNPEASAAIRRLTGPDASPLLVIAPASESLERILALEMGADDLVGDEAEPREILTRLHGLIRRRRAGLQDCTHHGAHPLSSDDAPPRASPSMWRLNPAQHALISPEGLRLDLTCGDEAVLSAFAENDGGLILDRDCPNGEVRTAISRLKRKALRDTGVELPILNIWGRGYRFDAPLVRI